MGLHRNFGWGNRYYIDPLSIQRNGPIVSYLQLTNYPQGTDTANKAMLSFVQFKTNDCARNQFTISRLIGYEKPHGQRASRMLPMSIFLS